jgi:hypothetical protein
MCVSSKFSSNIFKDKECVNEEKIDIIKKHPEYEVTENNSLKYGDGSIIPYIKK